MNWPVAPLLEAGAMMAGRPAHRGVGACPFCVTGRCYSLGTLAEDVGVADRSAHRWAATGVPAVRADQAATAIGLHPVLVWPNFYDQEVA